MDYVLYGDVESRLEQSELAGIIMKVLLEQQDREFLQSIHQHDDATISTLCQELDLTATAVRQRLQRLLRKNLIERITIRKGRGRPYHIYHITQSAKELLGDNYTDLACVMWKELQHIPDEDLRNRVIARVKTSLAARIGQVAETHSVNERVEILAKNLQSQGYHITTQIKDGSSYLVEQHCPFVALTAENRKICQLEEAVLSEAAGVPLQLTLCCLDGHQHCEFTQSININQAEQIP